jgi:hypothetical protein
MDEPTALMDWSLKGMRTLTLENKLLRVSVLLDKGSDIFEVKYKPLDLDVIWHAPWGYRNLSNDKEFGHHRGVELRLQPL